MPLLRKLYTPQWEDTLHAKCSELANSPPGGVQGRLLEEAAFEVSDIGKRKR